MNLDEIRERLNGRRDELRSMRIAVLAGGISAEREISIASGLAVASQLRFAGYSPELICIDRTGLGLSVLVAPEHEETALAAISSQLAAAAKSDTIHTLKELAQGGVVFTVMHGTWGEDGVFQGLFELLGLPYVCADVHGSALAMDKLASKRIAKAIGVLTPDYWVVRPEDTSPVTFPGDLTELVIKPASQGSSVGIEMVDNDGQAWGKAHKAAGQYGIMLVERRIYGRELTVAVIGHASEPAALPVVEIAPTRDFYDYTAKYTSGASNYTCPALIDDDVAHRVRQSASLIYRELGLAPYARIDYLLDDNNRAWFLEANTLPGFTNLSLLPMAARAAGVEFPELVEMLLLLALERHEGRVAK